MFGIDEYLDQETAGRAITFSEIKYAASVVAGGVNGISIDYNKQGAVWILCTTIDISLPAPAAPIVTITDAWGRVVKSFDQVTEWNGSYLFAYCVKQSALRFTCSSLAVSFVIAHQYISINK